MLSFYFKKDMRFTELSDRINDLEAIGAELGSVPRHYHDRTDQLQGQVTYLQNKVNELLKPKKRATPKAKGVVQL